MIVYFSGMFLAIILILVLAHYEKQRGSKIDDLPVALCLSAFSWVTVLLFILSYKDTYKKIFRGWFNKD